MVPLSEPVSEYNLYVRMPKHEIHMLGYIMEADDHIMNIRHTDESDSTVKIIVPADLLTEAIDMLNQLKEELELEIIRYGPNPGNP
jgi:hypothetical protein